MITQNTEHFGYHVVFLEETPMAGKTKIDKETLIQQGMISVTHDYYSVLIHKRFIIALPNPNKVSIADYSNCCMSVLTLIQGKATMLKIWL